MQIHQIYDLLFLWVMKQMIKLCDKKTKGTTHRIQRNSRIFSPATKICFLFFRWFDSTSPHSFLSRHKFRSWFFDRDPWTVKNRMPSAAAAWWDAWPFRAMTFITKSNLINFHAPIASDELRTLYNIHGTRNWGRSSAIATTPWTGPAHGVDSAMRRQWRKQHDFWNFIFWL